MSEVRSESGRKDQTVPDWRQRQFSGGAIDEKAAKESASGEVSFADELATLKETVANLVASVGAGAASTIKEAGNQVASAAGGVVDAGTSAANFAGEQAKSLANELESFGRRNPLGAMGSALAIGVLLGLIGRGRH
jgi:ElaB/YqjD/DUF883 family membrane-anchored ribosome-binding protein